MTDKLTLEYWRLQLDELWLERIAMVHRGKDVDEAINQAFCHLISDDMRLKNATSTDFKQLVNSWLSNKRFPKKQVSTRIDLSNL